MLAETAQIFHKEPHENALREPGGKFEMISPGENRIQLVLNSHEELQKIGIFFFKFQSISILAICKPK